MVGLVDVELVAGEVVVLPGYQGEKDHVLVYAAWKRLAEVHMTTRCVWLLYMQDADYGAVRYIQAEQLHPCMMTWLLQRGTDETPVLHRAAWGDAWLWLQLTTQDAWRRRMTMMSRKIVEQLQGGTLRPPQDPLRLVPKCAPGCIF